jgi:hypothetical protein
MDKVFHAGGARTNCESSATTPRTNKVGAADSRPGPNIEAADVSATTRSAIRKPIAAREVLLAESFHMLIPPMLLVPMRPDMVNSGGVAVLDSKWLFPL